MHQNNALLFCGPCWVIIDQWSSNCTKLTDDAEDGYRRDEDPLRVEPELFQFTLNGVVDRVGRLIGDQLLRHVRVHLVDLPIYLSESTQ